ncbi:MAG: serine hydrolase [Rhizobiaceae bacterium]|nr:serine hydrolase [Rhizobiaceae bacterium]
MKLLKYAAYLLVLLCVVAVGWVFVSPPDLFRVGSNYSAKIICSNYFLANRDPERVLEVDVQAPGHPLLRLMQAEVDSATGIVRTGLFGVIGQGMAVYRKGFGCTPVPDRDLAAVTEVPEPSTIAEPDAQRDWPLGSRIATAKNSKLEAVLADDALAGPGMRAIVVVKDGKIVGERYAPGFGPQTPMLGWSMAKTVTGALVGRLIQQNQIDLQGDNLFAHWANDNRSKITLQDLLGMASDLQWNEGYGAVSDVTRMLFLSPDMASLATNPPLNEPSGGEIGTHYNYSSGTSVIIARYLQDQQPSVEQGLLLAHNQLFAPLGMSTAVIEPDARGTLTGGSYMYASPRDWARMGQFLLQKGVWRGQQLLPEGYVDWMTETHPAHWNGRYGRGHVWLTPPGSGRPGDNPEFNHKAFWMAGHDAQSIGILPEEGLVIVRLGLTPSKLLYKPAKLANAVVEALK